MTAPVDQARLFRRLRWRLLMNTLNEWRGVSLVRPLTIVASSIFVWAFVFVVAYAGLRFMIVEAKVPPGKLEPKHRHPKGVTVYLANYTVEQKSFPDGRVTRGERKFGTVTWADDVVHEVKNVGQTPSHAVRIELKY